MIDPDKIENTKQGFYYPIDVKTGTHTNIGSSDTLTISISFKGKEDMELLECFSKNPMVHIRLDV